MTPLQSPVSCAAADLWGKGEEKESEEEEEEEEEAEGREEEEQEEERALLDHEFHSR